MPIVHGVGGGNRQQPQLAQQPQHQQSYTGQTQQVPQQYNAPAPMPSAGTAIIVGLTIWETLGVLLINGGVILVMCIVGYFGWNFGLLGLGGIIRVDLYHLGPMWTFNETYDLNIGVHHLIPFTMSLIEWQLMPYEKYVRGQIWKIKIYWVRKKQKKLAMKPWQVRTWWTVMLLDVGTNYGGVAAFFIAGVTIPLPGIQLVLATAGIALFVQAFITSVAFAFAPEPTIRGALKQIGTDTGWWIL